MIADALHQEIALAIPDPRIRLSGAASEGGGVTLAATFGPPEPLETGEPHDAASIDIGPDGAIWLADPEHHAIVRVDPCDGRGRPLRCLTGPGTEPGRVLAPRGLAVGPRAALYVADTGNHRIQVVDLDTGAVRDVWGPADPYAAPAPGPAPGEFDEPVDVAADAAGGLYVADAGNARVQKLHLEGRAYADFESAWRNQPDPPARPLAVATLQTADGERLVVLGLDARGRLAIWLHELDGRLDAERTQAWRAGLTGAAATPATVASMGAGSAAIADAASPGRLLVLDDAGTVRASRRCGRAVAALAAGDEGLVAAGPGGLLRLGAGAARERAGVVLVGPLAAEPAFVQLDRLTRWQRILLDVDGLGARTGAALATCTMLTAADPPPLPPEPGTVPSADLTPAGTWRRAPAGALEALALNEPAPFLWIAIELRGDGAAAPTARHLSVRYDHAGWRRHLPAVYSEDAAGRELLDRVLGALEAALDEEEALLERLPLLFDPAAAPDAPGSGWLDWLAGWVAVELEAGEPSERRRSAVAEAFARHARRGTVKGLREEVARALDGGPVAIDEPGARARLWQLGAEGLGFGTRLVPAEADGAVLDTTAVLDHSYLLAEDEHGLALFADVAHCIVVHVPPLDEAGIERVRLLVEREKPAHVVAHVCPVRPLARLGFQSTVGVDAVVARGSEPLVLGAAGPLGAGARLPDPERTGIGGAVGADAQLGTTTVVT